LFTARRRAAGVLRRDIGRSVRAERGEKQESGESCSRGSRFKLEKLAFHNWLGNLQGRRPLWAARCWNNFVTKRFRCVNLVVGDARAF
jgi:hypothetical protein